MTYHIEEVILSEEEYRELFGYEDEPPEKLAYEAQQAKESSEDEVKQDDTLPPF